MIEWKTSDFDGPDDDFSELMAVALCDEDGLVAFLRGYMDESGTHDGSNITCVSLLVAAPQNWRDWKKKWEWKKKPVEVFHAVDCANRVGEFKGWSKEDRDRYVKDLLPIIGSARFAAWVVGVDNRDVEKAQKLYPVQEVLTSPYLFCLQLAIQKALFFLDNNQDTSNLALIHEDNDYKKDAVRCFDWIKNGSWCAPRDMTLSFASKKKAVALQAADVFAYEGNKRMRNIDGPERKAWRAINPGRNKVSLDYFGYDAIVEWMRMLMDENRL